MILSYNIEGNSDDSENENCESTTKSIHNHTESSGVNSSKSNTNPQDIQGHLLLPNKVHLISTNSTIQSYSTKFLMTLRQIMKTNLV